MLSMSANRLLILFSLGLIVAAWWYAAMLEWRGERLTRDIINHKAPAAAYNQVPLSPAPARAAAQRSLVADAPEHGRIDELLAYSLNLRPIYAPYWLDRAEAAYQAGDMPAAESHLGTAVSLWPTRPALLWKAAMLQTRLGNVDPALATLNSYLRADPHGCRPAVAVASRLETDAARMLDAILPDTTADDVGRDELVWRIVRDARATSNAALAQAAWRELSGSAQNNLDAVRDYVEWMIVLKEPGEAVSAWKRYRALDPLPALENGGFEDELRGGLGWRINDRGSARIERDIRLDQSNGPSLKITFPGSENLNFHHVRQYLPVKPGRLYTLSFDWRGKNISTRSGPYVEVHAPSDGRLVASQGQWGTWDWQPQSLDFTVPDSVEVVEVRVRRNPTTALDNEIQGSVWFDNFRLAAPNGEEVSD
ncbi:MAG: hypothetical protein U5R46_11040 [Gammaproteobacteria bacterium]|nr:hypothetical protein [Gammaproteobacteria bacterium]